MVTAASVFVALDYPALEPALACATTLAPFGVRFKLGLELFCRCGPPGVAALQGVTGPLLLDLKLHDIPRTVGRATAALCTLGAWGLTLHAAGGAAMLRAAVQAAQGGAGEPLRCLAVTVLTSLDEPALQALGVRLPLREQVASLTRLAQEAGCAGAVASPQEAAVVRAAAGPAFLVVTPGVRPAGVAAGDQARVATPQEAIAAGADALVVGRAVTAASDPPAALRRLLLALGATAARAAPD